ncbi:MAG: EAL domain-containing protein [Sterolibacterium sp.]|nr:EAL domain-containing protein [Sterolibacterium sp.]
MNPRASAVPGQLDEPLLTLSLAVEQSPVSIIITDPKGNIQYVNPKFEQLTGYTSAEAVGQNPRILSSGELPTEGYREMWVTLTAGNTWQGVFHNRRKDGTPFWEKASISPIFDKQGKLIHFVAVKEDITERRRAEAELRIAAIAFESQEGMAVTDTRQVILRVNHAFTEITGYSAAEAVGQTPKLLSSGRHDRTFYADMWEGIRRTGSWQGEIWNRRKNGEVYPEWLTITAVKADDGAVSHYVSTLTDITLRKAAADEIELLAFYDPLTKLPNRRLLLDRLQQALAASARSKRQGALLFIDLDNFKLINDTLGHDQGDLLLQQVAQRLASCVREEDTVARLGGDEFVVMLLDLNENLEEAGSQTEVVGQKILQNLNYPYALKDQEYHCTPSIGITLFRSPHKTVDELLKRADLAMYQAKAAGRNTLRFFDPEMQASVTARTALESDLRLALRERQFELYYQAQMIGLGQLTGAEALLRWRHPLRGLVSPLEFIPLAEETGLILPLGQWVLETACAQLADWALRPGTNHLTVAVNVSARQFRQADFVDQVVEVIERSGADPQRLKLELTESLLLDDVEDIIAKMTALKARGVGFSLDDFGTGYSSLSYLKRLPLDQLKIDQSFVRDVFTDPNDAAIARTIVALAQGMGLSVIAEGVETEEQRDFLAGQGCHACQGYLFSRPLPLAAFEKFLKLGA